MPMESSPENPQPLEKVVRAVKGWVERLGTIWVEGQLIEIRRRTNAPTQFLTLRDRFAEVSASLTCSRAVLDAAGPLSEGATVTALIRPTVWAGSGRLTFECTEIRPSGEGLLLAQLEQRKRLLQAEGLFDPERRKRLPFLPRGIGVITGKDSAAERDIVSNVLGRWPAARLVVRHALVQGPSAAAEVMTRLGELDADPSIDVIVIARGGGSLEDLLPFSDEGLVRAVAACRTPVVSAIGHEPDTPILDLVADLRASTPTDAAKRVVPDVAEEHRQLEQWRQRLRRAVSTRIGQEQAQLDQLRSRPVLRDPLGGFDLWVEQIANLRRRLASAIDRTLDRDQTDLAHSLSRVRALSPRATLERGYAILVDADGGGITSAAQPRPGDAVQARLHDGNLELEVTASAVSQAVSPDSPPSRPLDPQDRP